MVIIAVKKKQQARTEQKADNTDNAPSTTELYRGPVQSNIRLMKKLTERDLIKMMNVKKN